MMLPTVHMNGTAGSELEAKYLEAYKALNFGLTKLSECNPNGRDYYPQGNDAINLASKEHTERLRRIKSVLDEIYQIYDHVAE